MLLQPTIDKMLTMKMNGMVEALDEQRKSADTTTWSFEDRLAMLVERQWLWKENEVYVWNDTIKDPVEVRQTQATRLCGGH